MQYPFNNLRKALREAAARVGLPAFWRWWVTELTSLVPGAVRVALRRHRLPPILAFDEGVAVLWEPRVVDNKLVVVEAARIPLGSDQAAAAQASRTLQAASGRGTAGGTPVKIVVALPRAQILRKQLTLPTAVEEDLMETLTFDLDRHTPFRADQLYFDAVVIDRNVEKRQIRVDWAAALRTTVDAARRHAESWGALVVGVTPEVPEPGSASGTVVPPGRSSRLNLLPAEERPNGVYWRHPQFLLPAALLALMGLAAIVVPIWQKREYAIALTETTEHARVQAAAADALRQQLEQATGDYNFALGKKYAFPSMVQLLDDVTKILPDDTWLTQFEVKGVAKGKEAHRDILLRGESANAGRLVSALEDSKMFEQAAPRSPTTKIQPGPGEVFDLGAQVKPLPLPELVQLAAVTPAAPAPAGTVATPAARENAAAPAAAAPAAAPAAATPATDTPAAAAGPATGPNAGVTTAAPPAAAAPTAPSARTAGGRGTLPAAPASPLGARSRTGSPGGAASPTARPPQLPPGPAGSAANGAAPAPDSPGQPEGTPPAADAPVAGEKE